MGAQFALCMIASLHWPCKGLAVQHLKWYEWLIGLKTSLLYQLRWLSQALRGLEHGS